MDHDELGLCLQKGDYTYPCQTADGRDDLESRQLKILRGGCFFDELRYARCAVRAKDIPEYFGHGSGFRVVLSLGEP